MNPGRLIHRCLIVLLAISTATAARAQSPCAAAADILANTSVDGPTGFVIGPDDVLSIVLSRDTEMTRQVTVRPDGNSRS